MIIAGFSYAAAASSSLSVVEAPTVNVASFTPHLSSKSMTFGTTSASDDIMLCIYMGRTLTDPDAELTVPANMTRLQWHAFNGNTWLLYRWDGSGTRPTNGSPVSVTNNQGSTSWLGGLTYFVSGTTRGTGTSGKTTSTTSAAGPHSGPAGLSANSGSLIMNLWLDAQSTTVTPTAPTTGFSTSAPGSYPATAGFLSPLDIRDNVHPHWGIQPSTYVTPTCTTSATTYINCFVVEHRP